LKNQIFIVAEHRDGRLKPASLELAGFGKRLAGASGNEAVGVILGSPCAALAEKFAAETGLKVIGVENEKLASYNPDGYVAALAKTISERRPAYVLVSHTATGWDFAPRLAVEINGACSTAVTGFAAGEEMAFTRSICGGKIALEVAGEPGKIRVLTVMPGITELLPPEGPGGVEIIRLDLPTLLTANLGYVEAKRGALDLTKAEVIVAAGRGIGEQEKLELVKNLAECFDKAAVGASRPVVDAGWLPLEHQVGQTGQTVRPKLYIACGISGAVQHTAGMAGAELIVAVNTDPKANIFNLAHIGVVQDLHQFLPALIKKVCRRKRPSK